LFATSLPKSDHGSFETRSISDNQLRLYSYVSLRSYPIVINSNQTKNTILADWRGNRADAGRIAPKGFPKNNKFRSPPNGGKNADAD
jgi:hypothetical protein